MNTPLKPAWLDWARRLQAIAQTGLAFAQNSYDTDRYHAVEEIVAEIVAAGSGAELSLIRDLISKDTGYPTPKVDVRGVVFREDRLLLVRERSDGRWSLPGGWADINESPSESVAREILEEAGLQTRCVKLLAMFDRGKHPHEPRFLFHVYKLFIRCEIIGGAAAAGGETDGAAFFGETELPELSISRITPWQIQRMFEHLRNPDWPTDLD
jgi:ADP-ribose pyrophosphatase YjhB (NUDIX family)